ncbi:hypothetical protein FRC19_006246 [Serendipita sp. 401]|nr:hypothetical protein FRC19_006246 [Serendipita sp. 401]
MAGKETEVAPIPAAHQQLTDAIKHNLHLFATGNDQIQTTALDATKSLFDSALSQENAGFESIKRFVQSMANDMSAQPRETRSQKQARAADQPEGTAAIHPTMNNILIAANKLQPTPVKQLHTTNMDTDQLWNQLELRAKAICDLVDIFFEGEYPDPEALAGDEEEGDAMDVDEEDEEDSSYEETDDKDENEAGDGSDSDSEQDLGEHTMPLANERPHPSRTSTSRFPIGLRPPTNREEAAVETNGSVGPKRVGPRHPTLDDDFFSISEFNREIESAEAKTSSKGKLKASKGGDSDDDDDDESIDLFTPVGDASEGGDEELDSDEDGTADGDVSYPLMYSDFFDKPSNLPASSSKAQSTSRGRNVVGADRPSIPATRPTRVRFHEEVKVKLIKSRRKKFSLMDLMDEGDEEDDDELPPFDEGWDDEEQDDGNDDEEAEKDEEEEDEDEDEDEDGEEDYEENGFDAIERAKDDLFADEDEDSMTDLSTHAQRQIALKEQITALEQENIAAKDWTMQGEASSRSRPLNSLLEEDLEFEHRQRVAPVMTEEKIKGVEEIIRARIVEGRYDDVVRRRAVDDKPFLPSKYFELQDAKSAQSLAQIYEDEYLASSSNPGSKSSGIGAAIDDRDGKLKKEHDELETIWENIAGKLDALCNAHFTPKTARGVISTVSNVPSTTLESALPTAKNVSSLLTPEEVFSTRVPGVIASKVEMTPGEKQSERMKRRKKRMKMAKVLDRKVVGTGTQGNGKIPDNQPTSENGKSSGKGKKRLEKEEKARALKSVVKSGKGVTVVGKGSGKSRGR